MGVFRSFGYHRLKLVDNFLNPSRPRHHLLPPRGQSDRNEELLCGKRTDNDFGFWWVFSEETVSHIVFLRSSTSPDMAISNLSKYRLTNWLIKKFDVSNEGPSSEISTLIFYNFTTNGFARNVEFYFIA